MANNRSKVLKVVKIWLELPTFYAPGEVPAKGQHRPGSLRTIFGKRRKNVQTTTDPKPVAVIPLGSNSLRGVPIGRNAPRQHLPGTISLSVPEQEPETDFQFPASYPYS